MDGPGSKQRMTVALVVIACAAVGVWVTIEPGKPRVLAWVLLGFFAFRVLIGRMRHQNSERAQRDREESGHLQG